MNEQNTSISFLQFAWNSLTEHQQIRINLKYELKQRLGNLSTSECKRDVYRLIADKYCLSMRRVEDIANTNLKK